MDDNQKQLNEELIEHASFRRWNLAKKLLKNGADIHYENGNIFIDAIREGNLEIIQYLLESPELTEHADLSRYGERINFGCFALLKKSPSIVEYLINKGLDISEHHGTYLLTAIETQNHRMLKLLHKSGVDLGMNYDRALRTAVDIEDYTAMDFLLANGANVNTDNDLLIRNSVLTNKMNLVNYLIEHGASIDKAIDYCDGDLKEKLKKVKLTKDLEADLPLNVQKKAKIRL